MSSDDVLLGLGLVLVLAVGAQLVARVLRIPAIVVLLPTGFVAGAITDVVEPDLGAAVTGAVNAVPAGQTVVVFSTYTAMWHLHQQLDRLTEVPA